MALYEILICLSKRKDKWCGMVDLAYTIVTTSIIYDSLIE